MSQRYNDRISQDVGTPTTQARAMVRKEPGYCVSCGCYTVGQHCRMCGKQLAFPYAEPQQRMTSKIAFYHPRKEVPHSLFVVVALALQTDETAQVFLGGANQWNSSYIYYTPLHYLDRVESTGSEMLFVYSVGIFTWGNYLKICVRSVRMADFQTSYYGMSQSGNGLMLYPQGYQTENKGFLPLNENANLHQIALVDIDTLSPDNWYYREIVEGDTVYAEKMRGMLWPVPSQMVAQRPASSGVRSEAPAAPTKFSLSAQPRDNIVYYLYCPACGVDHDASANICRECGEAIPKSKNAKYTKLDMWSSTAERVKAPKFTAVGHDWSRWYGYWALEQRGFMRRGEVKDIPLGCFELVPAFPVCPECQGAFEFTDSSVCSTCGWHYCPCCGNEGRDTGNYCVYCGVYQAKRHYIQSLKLITNAIGYCQPRGGLAYFKVGIILYLPSNVKTTVSLGKFVPNKGYTTIPEYTTQEAKQSKVLVRWKGEKQLTWTKVEYVLTKVKPGEMISLWITDDEVVPKQINLYRVTEQGLQGGVCESVTLENAQSSSDKTRNWGVVEFTRVGLYDLDRIAEEDKQEQEAAKEQVSEEARVFTESLSQQLQELTQGREEREERADYDVFLDLSGTKQAEERRAQTLVSALRDLLQQDDIQEERTG